MHLFHYTVGSKLARIQAAGALLPSAVPLRCSHELPVLWFSANQEWEPTATKPVITPDGARVVDAGLLQHKVGLYRFVWSADVDSPDLCPRAWRLTRWPQIAVAAHIRERERTAMAASGLRMGSSPRDWYGRLHPMAIDDLGLQKLNLLGMWEDIRLEHAVAEFAARSIRVLDGAAV